jgi:hypothetical protein
MTVISRVNPVPMIVTIEPPAAEPKAGKTPLTVGRAAAPPGEGVSGDLGDGEHPAIAHARAMRIEGTARPAKRMT